MLGLVGLSAGGRSGCQWGQAVTLEPRPADTRYKHISNAQDYFIGDHQLKMVLFVVVVVVVQIVRLAFWNM